MNGVLRRSWMLRNGSYALGLCNRSLESAGHPSLLWTSLNVLQLTGSICDPSSEITEKKEYCKVISMLWKIQANNGKNVMEQHVYVSSVLSSTKIKKLKVCLCKCSLLKSHCQLLEFVPSLFIAWVL